MHVRGKASRNLKQSTLQLRASPILTILPTSLFPPPHHFLYAQNVEYRASILYCRTFGIPDTLTLTLTPTIPLLRVFRFMFHFCLCTSDFR